MVLGLMSNEIKVKIKEEKDCVRTLSVEMPAAVVAQKIEQAFQNVQSQVKIPGFRPGKAPIEQIKKSYQDAAYEKAQDLLLREGVEEALKSKKIHPIESPVILSINFAPEKPFQFEFSVEVTPEIKVSSYKGLKVSKKTKKVGDEDVTKALQTLTDVNAKLTESKDTELKNTHYAVVDYSSSIEGKPIEGAKADNFLIDMSAPQNIAGLAEGLIGAKPGEERDVTVTFPADSPSKELAGKQAVFKVKVNAIKEKSVPAIDDEFAKDMGFESLANLKEKVKESLEKEHEQAAKADIDKQVVDGLLEENKFAVPPSMVQRQADYLLSRQKERMVSQGVSEKDQTGLLDRLKPDALKEAEREVRLAYILNEIAKLEKIEVSEAEINEKIDNLVERSKPQDREAVQKMLREKMRDRVRSDVHEAKLFGWLLEHAKIKEVS